MMNTQPPFFKEPTDFTFEVTITFMDQAIDLPIVWSKVHVQDQEWDVLYNSKLFQDTFSLFLDISSLQQRENYIHSLCLCQQHWRKYTTTSAILGKFVNTVAYDSSRYNYNSLLTQFLTSQSYWRCPVLLRRIAATYIPRQVTYLTNQAWTEGIQTGLQQQW